MSTSNLNHITIKIYSIINSLQNFPDQQDTWKLSFMLKIEDDKDIMNSMTEVETKTHCDVIVNTLRPAMHVNKSVDWWKFTSE